MKKLLTFLTLLTLFFGVGWAADITYTFNSKSWGATPSNWSGTADGNQFNTSQTPKGVQVTTSAGSGATVTCPTSYSNISKVIVTYSSSSKGVGSIAVKIGSTTIGTKSISKSQTETDLVYEPTSPTTGVVSFVPTCTTNSFGINSVTITYGEAAQTYTVTCNPATNGSITANPTSAEANSTVTINATPTDGYKLNVVTVNPTENGVTAPEVTISGNTATFTMPASNVTVDATFTLLPTYGITVTGGTASTTSAYEGQTVTVTPEIPSGKIVDTYTVTPSTVTLTPDGDNYTFTMPGEAVSISFTFKDDPAANAATATFDATVDKGTSPLSKGPVTFACSNGILNNGTEYRLYANSTTTFSVPEGYKIVKIEFTGTDTDKPLTGLSTTTGNYTATQLSGTWIGEAESVTFTASAQSRATLIKVYYTAPDVTSNIYRVIKTNGETSTAGGWLGNWTNCTVDEEALNAGNANYTVTANAGTLVQFKAGTNEGYQIHAANVSAVDADNNVVALTTVTTEDSGITFSFTMPASEVTITANFTTYRPTLRMAGRFNGGTETGDDSRWVTDNSGPVFTYDATNDKYTLDVYFIGASNDNGTMVDYFYFRSDNSDLKAQADGNYWVTTLGSDLSNALGGSANFRIEPGVYTITINGARNIIRFDKLTPELTFSPASGTDVYVGQSVTATSSLSDIISAIKATDSGAAGEVSVQVSGDNTTFADSYAFRAVGSQTVYGKATIGNITVTDEASYNVQEAAGGDQYILVTDASQLVSGNDYVIVTSKQMNNNYYALGTSISNGTAAQSTDFVLADNTVTVTGETVNVLTLTGDNTNGWDIKTSNGNYLTGSTNGNLAASSNSTPDDTWSVSIDNNNIATITYGATTTRSIIYRTSAEGFKNYATSNANSDGYSTVKLYMKPDATPTVEDPVFTPAAGTYTEAQNVTITCATDGATIYYTTNGSTPSAENGIVYSAAIPVSETTTIRAIAVKEGYRSSSVVSAKYTIEIPVDPGEGEFTLVTSTDQLIPGCQYILVWREGPLTMSNAANTNNFLSTDIELSTDQLTATADENTEILTLEGEEDAWMFYVPESEGYLACSTGDSNRLFRTGTEDSDASKATIAITEAGRATIKFNAGTRNIIFYNHSNNPDLWSCYASKQTDYEYPALYYRQNGIAKPTFDPAEGIYNVDVTASISCATDGATIYYTTNGDEPTTSSTVYNGEFVVSETTTVKAIAVKDDESSPVASVTYTIARHTETETVQLDYTEALTDGIGKFTVENESGFAPVWTLDGHYGIKGTAYDGENHVATSWFLSPIIDMTGANTPELRFDHQINNFFSNVTEQATLWVREYTNGVAGAWTPMNLTFSTPDPARGWTDDHAYFDMSEYIDKQIQIGFKYVNTSTESGAGTWEIQNFSVTDNTDVIMVNNIAEFMDMEKVAKGETAKFRNPVVVLYHYQQYLNSTEDDYENDYIWIKDESGYAIIYGHYLDVEYVNGDVIPAGFTATKNYYSTGKFYQLYEPEGLLPATEKALADPEPVTLATLLANKNGYNGHYVTISKMQIQFNQGELEAYTSSTSGQRRFSVGDATVAIADNQAGTTASANNGKIIGYNNFDNPWLETLDYPTYENTTSVYGDYNITGIFEQYNGTWEFMPLIITPWEAAKLTLHDLCLTGVEQEIYTISNPLQVVYVDTERNSVWVKDGTGQSIYRTSPAEDDKNFAIEYPSNTRSQQAYYDQSNWCQLVFDGEIPTALASRPIINGGIITGKFTNKMNPTLENIVLGENAIMQESSTYVTNYYMAANFLGSQKGYFFMNPKPQEYADIVWAIYDEANNAMIMPTDANQNTNGFEGSFKVDMSMNINPNLELVDGTQTGKGYEHFKAIVRLASTSNAPMLKDRMPANTEYVVFPLDITQDVPTGITDVNGKAVKSVKYVNVAGMVSDKPFSGVNIVVTEYTDGSRTTSKMLRK